MNMTHEYARDIGRLTDLVLAARAILADGRIVDLSGLAQQVRAVTDKLRVSRLDDSRSIKPALLLLVEEFDRLRDEICRQHVVLSHELKNLDIRHGAATAYGRLG
ncbi:MAG: hypothetical protein ACKVSF_15900 [Alphaproteobacteria bacterium]